jgi:hypothetical protein
MYPPLTYSTLSHFRISFYVVFNNFQNPVTVNFILFHIIPELSTTEYAFHIFNTPSYHQDTGWLILTVSLWVVEVYQICTAYFSQVMHFIITWLCAVRRGKGTGHPTPFDSWLSMPRSGCMGRALGVFMSVCMCRYMRVHGCMGMRTWCRHCMRIQPAFGLITVHTYIHTYIHTFLTRTIL